MSRRKDGVETRARILKIAGRLFAEKGYERTIFEEICDVADVNTGAINYHFQSKENLYREAWRHAFQDSLAKHPIDGGVLNDAPAEERLRGRILSFLRRTADPENIEFEIVHKEMANPSGLLAEVMRESLKPLRDDMLSIVRELLGGGAMNREIQLCEMSIMGQCLNPIIMHKKVSMRGKGMGAEPLFVFEDIDLESMAEHVTNFSLAGMRAIAAKFKKK